MGKKILLVFVLINIFSFFGAGQPALINPIKKKYQANEKLSQASKYNLLQLKEGTPQAIKNLFYLKAQRKFTENIYIIDTTLLPNYATVARNVELLIAANNDWKLSPVAAGLKAEKERQSSLFQYQILCSQLKFIEPLLVLHPELSSNNISIQKGQNIITLICDFKLIQNLFLNEDAVIFIDVLIVKPIEELGTPGYDLSTNKINLVHSQYPSINGLGQHVSIKEDYYDTTDIDIKGRFEKSPLASSNVSNHANFMATIIAGAGNSANYALGAAAGAMISSSSFSKVLPDADNSYLQNNISVQNHSYGTVIDNNYGLAAVAFDNSANRNDGLLHVFSSGNSGADTSTFGNYSGIAGYANLTGNFKMAKNILTVGAVDSFGNAAVLSSKGPAYDGRIKPELVAFQQNGTSESAALVSGTALLLQQYYAQLHPQKLLPSALAKAILINTADDIGTPGPDFTTGFGNMNASKAMNLIRDNKIFSGISSQRDTQIFSINIPANISQLKVTLVWNDLAASPLANKALINDVDLEISLPANNLSWKPWVLNSFANSDSLNSMAVRNKDSLNNIEQVTISMPLQGKYDIKINGYNLPTGTQKYYVVYSWDSLNVFKWQRPIKTDLVAAGSHSILRWQNSYSGNGSVALSIVSSNKWQPVAPNIDLQKGYVYWNVPDTIAPANLRMKIGNEYFYSDTFLVTTLPTPATGYICGDSILIHWNKLKNINRYQLYQLGSKYMEPLFSVYDTIVKINKNNLKDKYLAVAPVLDNGMNASKSYAFNYSTQGAGCYIDAFYVDKNADAAKLSLLLGTLFNVNEINFEKLVGSGYTTIKSYPISTRLQYDHEYGPLQKGITYFRTKIVLINGQVIYSKPEAVFYAAPGKYVLLPVPVQRNNDITLITTVPDGEFISIIDVLGRCVLQQELQSARELIKTSQLQPAQYFYLITKKGVRLASGKLIIL